MDQVSLWTVFASEVTGTAFLILLGVGVVANVLLTESKGFAAGWIVIIFGILRCATLVSVSAQLNILRSFI